MIAELNQIGLLVINLEYVFTCLAGLTGDMSLLCFVCLEMLRATFDISGANERFILFEGELVLSRTCLFGEKALAQVVFEGEAIRIVRCTLIGEIAY